jgi:hypothetical protein
MLQSAGETTVAFNLPADTYQSICSWACHGTGKFLMSWMSCVCIMWSSCQS